MDAGAPPRKLWGRGKDVQHPKRRSIYQGGTVRTREEDEEVRLPFLTVNRLARSASSFAVAHPPPALAVAPAALLAGSNAVCMMHACLEHSAVECTDQLRVATFLPAGGRCC